MIPAVVPEHDDKTLDRDQRVGFFFFIGGGDCRYLSHTQHTRGRARTGVKTNVIADNRLTAAAATATEYDLLLIYISLFRTHSVAREYVMHTGRYRPAATFRRHRLLFPPRARSRSRAHRYPHLYTYNIIYLPIWYGIVLLNNNSIECRLMCSQW